MSLFDKSFGMNNQKPDNESENAEGYILGIYDNVEQVVFYVVARSRKELAKLFEKLTQERYVVLGIQLLTVVKDYKALLKELNEKQKPDDMEFGDNREKGV
jgi:hypothetical protein